MDLRDKGKFMAIFARLNQAIGQSDRPTCERTFANIKSDLSAAAESLGVKVTSPFPHANASLDATVELLPDALKERAKDFASQLVTKSPMQMLYLEHVKSVRGVLD
jgi:hypothetical protein